MSIIFPQLNQKSICLFETYKRNLTNECEVPLVIIHLFIVDNKFTSYNSMLYWFFKT